MNHMIKRAVLPIAFFAAFVLFGLPRAPGVHVVADVAGVETTIGGCAFAYGLNSIDDLEDLLDYKNDVCRTADFVRMFGGVTTVVGVATFNPTVAVFGAAMYTFGAVFLYAADC